LPDTERPKAANMCHSPGDLGQFSSERFRAVL